MSTDIPHLRFLPDGSYDLSTPERRLAAAESLLATIAVMPRIYSSHSPSENRDEMARQAANMALNLRQAREQETARCAIGVEELHLTEFELREIIDVESLLDEHGAPPTAAAVSDVIGGRTRRGHSERDYQLQRLRTKLENAAARAVRIDTSAARPIHTADNLTDEQILDLLQNGGESGKIWEDCHNVLESDLTESQLYDARSRIAAELNERRLLAVVAQ